MTLTEFLLARITEDEGDAPGYPSPARWLAECEAKRQVVAIWEGAMSGIDDRIYDLAAHSLHALALPYVDHPDCRDEWRP